MTQNDQNDRVINQNGEFMDDLNTKGTIMNGLVGPYVQVHDPSELDWGFISRPILRPI